MMLIGNIFQSLGSLLLLYSYIPQIGQLIKIKRSGDMNTQFWAVLTIGLGCIAGNMYISKVPFFIFFTQAFNAVLALITLILVIKYKKISDDDIYKSFSEFYKNNSIKFLCKSHEDFLK